MPTRTARTSSARLDALAHHYRPRGAQAALFTCRDDEVLLSGPAGTGKSRACLEKLLFMALSNPGLRGLIVRKTLASLGGSALQTWRKFVIKEALAHNDVDFYGGSPEEPPQYRFTNGSAVVIGGLDNPLKIMSTEYDVIYVQEATELVPDDWQSLTTRLRSGVTSFQQLIADCNPNVPTHWLKRRCDDGITTMLDTKHEENPVLFDDAGKVTERGAAYITKLDNLTGVRKQRLRHGRWVAADGMVYTEWRQSDHVVPRFVVPRDWPRIWSIDFGFTNPFVWQCWVEDPDGRLILQREIYRPERTVDEHARHIMSLVSVADPDWRPTVAQQRGEDRVFAHEGRRWTEPRPEVIICDHDAEGRETLTQELGIGTIAANKSVLDGIQAVQRRMRPAGDGKPRIMLMADAVHERDMDRHEAGKPTCTAEEMPGYVWKPRPRTVIGEQKPAPEEPIKEDDHGLDAMRYAVVHRDAGRRANIRWL